MVAAASRKWGYVRIITGTILGGVLGFYVMHRVEISYKEKMNERLKKYEAELKKREKTNKLEESPYNLRSILSSATAVIKVLLGESPRCNLDTILPSKAGVQSVLEVLKIQMNFLACSGFEYSSLLSHWGMYCWKNRSEDLSQRLVEP